MKKKPKSILSLFVSCQTGCIRRFKPEFNAEDDLWNLCKYAFEEYRKDVRFGRKRYHRYVADVLSFNVPIASNKIADWKLHSKNLSCIHELLEDRIDLVRKYFMRDTFTLNDFENLLKELNFLDDACFESVENFSEQISEVVTFPSLLPRDVYIGHFTKEQLHVIVQFVNKVGLFTRKVSVKEMSSFFQCSLHDKAFVVNDLVDLVFFFECFT